VLIKVMHMQEMIAASIMVRRIPSINVSEKERAGALYLEMREIEADFPTKIDEFSNDPVSMLQSFMSSSLSISDRLLNQTGYCRCSALAAFQIFRLDNDPKYTVSLAVPIKGKSQLMNKINEGLSRLSKESQITKAENV
jgi:hypothetical protein